MNHTNSFFNSLIFLLILILSAGCQTKTPANEDLIADEDESDKVIQMEDLDGNEVRLQDFIGKTVVLNFWATWCKPCISEMPSIDRLIDKVGNEDIVFLAASDENIDKIKKFVEKNPHDFKYVHLKTNVYTLGLSVLPTTYIINKEGEVVEKVIGAKEWDSDESIQQIKSISIE